MINLYVCKSLTPVNSGDRGSLVVFMIRTWGQDSTTSLREVSSTWGQSDKSKYCKGICFFLLSCQERQTNSNEI